MCFPPRFSEKGRAVFLPVSMLFFLASTPCLFGQPNTDVATELLNKADSLRSASKLKQAEVTYKQVLVFDDNSVSAFKGLGKVAFQKQDWPEFHKWFNKALKVNPGDREAHDYLMNKSRVRQMVLSGDSLREAGQLDVAEREYKEALKLDEHYRDALKGMGKLAYARDDWDDVHKWFNRALEQHPGDIEAQDFLINSPKYKQTIGQADRSYSAGDLEKAEDLYDEVLEMNPHAVHPIKQLARMAMEQEDWGEVKNWYKKVLEYQPQELEANYGLGIAHRETGKFKALLLKRWDFNAAERHFQAVMDKDSSFRDVIYQRGLLARERENWLEAVKWGHGQVRIKPDLPHCNVGLYKLYRLLLVHESEDAVAAWLKQRPGDWADYMRGEQFRRRKNYQQADSVFSVLLNRQLSISKIPVLLSRVRCLVQEGRDAEANTQFQIALESIKTNVDAEHFFDFTKYILTDNEYDVYRRLTRAQQKRMFFTAVWTARNPTPAAPINKRFLEHCRRLTHAESNFWFDGVRSWANNPDKSGYLTYPKVYDLNDEFNDKGLIYIRHGEPDDIAKTSNRSTSNESWYYKPRHDRGKLIFHFVIEERVATGNNWRLTPIIADRVMLQDRVGWDAKLDRLYMALDAAADEDNQGEIHSLVNQLSDESEQVVQYAMSTDFHTYEKSVSRFDMPFVISSLRGFGRKTHVEVYFGVPLSRLDDGSNQILEFEHGAGIYDRNWQRLARSFEKVRLTPAESEHVHNGIFIQKYDFLVQPGDYNISFYASDEQESRIGREQVLASIPDLQSSALALSDPIPAFDILPTAEGTPFDKGEITIVPNPTREFSLDEPVFIYYEIYNLSPDEEGETRFRIKNEMTLEKGDSGGIFGFLSGGGKKSISIQNERTGRKPDAVEYTSFNVGKLEPGDYRLRVEIEDLVSGETVEKELALVLRKNES